MIMIIFTLIPYPANSQNPNEKLRLSLNEIVKTHKAIIGVAIIEIESQDTITINEQHHFPMQSVYKFPLALAVLDKIDKKELSITQKVHITNKDVQPNTWSPLKKKYPEGEIDLTVGDLLYYSVSMSDNIACDLLFKLVNGPAKVNKYIHQKGLEDIKISSTEQQMHSDWKYQYQNWCQPMTMSRMLEGLYARKYLTDSSNNLLLHLMTESSNSFLRIKGMLPEATVVAHKTGTSDTNSLGMRAANNDVGIITLPNGKHIAISVFVSDSFETYESDEKIIARITKAAYDYYSGSKSH